jgi:hypothetical protein
VLDAPTGFIGRQDHASTLRTRALCHVGATCVEQASRNLKHQLEQYHAVPRVQARVQRASTPGTAAGEMFGIKLVRSLSMRTDMQGACTPGRTIVLVVLVTGCCNADGSVRCVACLEALDTPAAAFEIQCALKNTIGRETRARMPCAAGPVLLLPLCQDPASDASLQPLSAGTLLLQRLPEGGVAGAQERLPRGGSCAGAPNRSARRRRA